MNIKSKTYMRNAEFKARQLWLDFTDAVGITLQIMADVKESAADWFKTWAKGFRTARTIKQPVQLAINFLQQRSIKEWTEWMPEKNLDNLPTTHRLRNIAMNGCWYRNKKGKSWKQIKPKYKIAGVKFNELGTTWTETSVFCWAPKELIAKATGII